MLVPLKIQCESSSKAVVQMDPVQSLSSIGMMNLRWTSSLKCPQLMHLVPDSAAFLHLGLLQASQNHLFLKLMWVIQTSRSEKTGSRVLLYITSASISFTKRLSRVSCALLSSRCSEVGSQSSLVSLPSNRLKRWFSESMISDRKMELKERVSRQLCSLKLFRRMVLSTHIGFMQRSLFHTTTSIDFFVSGSPTNNDFLKIVRSPFSMFLSSPISNSTAEKLQVFSRSFSPMICSRVGSELAARGMLLSSRTGTKTLSLEKIRLYLEQSLRLVWLQFSSRICPRDMRQMWLSLMRSWYSLALSPNITPSILMPVRSTSVMLKIFVSLPLLLVNSRQDFSITRTTISHLPWNPMQRSLIFSYCFSPSSVTSSDSSSSYPLPLLLLARSQLTGSTGLRLLEESFFSVLCSVGCWSYRASFLMEGSANYQILVFGAIFWLRGIKSRISSISFSFLVWVLYSVILSRYLSSPSILRQVSGILSPGRVRQITPFTLVLASLTFSRRYSLLTFTPKASTTKLLPFPAPWVNIVLMALFVSFIQVSNITPQFQIGVNLIDSRIDRAFIVTTIKARPRCLPIASCFSAQTLSDGD